MNPKNQAQKGFSLMELLIALMIIGVIASLGFKGYQKFGDQARYTKAYDHIRQVSEGLEKYYMMNGSYPDLGTWEAMVDAGSPLVKGHHITVNMPVLDPWKQPYEGRSGKGKYELKCAGDPNDQELRKPIVWREGGNVQGGPGDTGKGDTKGAAPAGDAAK
jgi:prepilin-type N-terminal cleavage/methylation domain-containing protein